MKIAIAQMNYKVGDFDYNKYKIIVLAFLDHYSIESIFTLKHRRCLSKICGKQVPVSRLQK